MESHEYFRETRGDNCEECGWRTASHRHHWLIKRRFRKYDKGVDDERNIGWLCTHCHFHADVDSYESKVRFWHKQKERYPDMVEWYSNLNLLTKENYE